MKFIHLSDLHIGKRVNEFPMLEDQKHILAEILEIADGKDAVVIAGDVYDKSIPPAEAVELFNEFITSLARKKIPVLIISGNHDSPERIGFGSEIMRGQDVYISGVFTGKPDKVSIKNTDFYLLPFIKTAYAKRFYPDAEIETTEDAVRVILQNTELNSSRKNVLVAHQFVTYKNRELIRSDSETVSIGGTDNVDAGLFDEFDYIALGHIHGPQSVNSKVRYCGSPLKYSFSEAAHTKSVTVVTVEDDIKIETVPLTPLRDMREIKGTLSVLTSSEVVSSANAKDYIHVTLTDEEEILDAIGKVRSVYPNVMLLDFENRRTSQSADISVPQEDDNKSPLELFGEFYQMQNNDSMSEAQTEIIKDILTGLEDGEI